MKRVVFLTTEDAEYGFRLAGYIHHTVSHEDVEIKLKSLIQDPDTGLIIMDERLLTGISDERLRRLQERWNGVITILPAPVKAEERFEDYIQRLIKRAIGYHVRLRI